MKASAACGRDMLTRDSSVNVNKQETKKKERDERRDCIEIVFPCN